MPGMTLATQDGPLLSANSISTAASAAIITGVAGSIIRVYRLFLTITTAAGTVQFTDGVTNFTGLMTLAAGIPLILPMDGNPYFICGKGNGFTLTLAATGQTSGAIFFTQQTL
jgi:hypothetical protein